MTAPSGRVLGIDLGTVRVGLSLSDPLRLTAQPFGRLERRLLKKGLGPLVTLAVGQEVSAFVVGHPLLLSGEVGEGAREAASFADRLREEAGLPVALWDERLTTVAAQRALIEGNVRRARRREIVDAAAATLMLQSWLDAQPR